MIVGQGLIREASDGISRARDKREPPSTRYIPAIIVIMKAIAGLLVLVNRNRIRKINIRGFRYSRYEVSPGSKRGPDGPGPPLPRPGADSDQAERNEAY